MAVLIGVWTSVVQAEVYKWTDASGKDHYSSKPPAKGAKPATLAPIMRGEVKLAPGGQQTCDKHGGINCALGPDQDGSVICYDGFRQAVSRFRFSCAAPKLEISDISKPDKNGGFTVFLRNSKSVAASGAVVKYKPSSGPPIPLSGPSQIDAFGVGEYQFTPKDPPLVPFVPTIADVIVSCAICPG